MAKDLIFILIGVALAIFMVKSGILDIIIGWIGAGPVSSFIAGIFFTSAFTMAPSSVALASISTYSSFWTVAVWGALGALCGDLVLFFFIKDRFANDLINSLKPSLVKHVMQSLHLGFIKWLSPLLGGIIIASPFPDEFGITLMGMTKVRLIVLIPVSFVMNALSIYALIWFASLL